MAPTRHSSNKENAISKTLLLGKGSSAPADPRVKRRVRSQCTRVVSVSVAADSVGSLGDFVEDGSVDNAPTKLHLPRQLPRPPYREANRNALKAGIAAVNPILSDMPVEYLQDTLPLFGERLYAAVADVEVCWPEGRPSKHLTAFINDIPISDLPSHVWAVYSARSKGQVSLHPAHAFIFAPNCSNLKPLPRIYDVIEGDRVTLDVFPLCLPHPETFHIVHEYLYLGSTNSVLSSLLPTYHESVDSIKLSIDLASSHTIPDLLALLSAVHGLWSNVAALGIFDGDLWAAIDLAWSILVTALEANNAQVPSGWP